MANAHQIDAKDVLSYLNQLGYTNISAYILKDFLTDLKKLIKSHTKRKSNDDIDSVYYNFTPVRNDNIWNIPINTCDLDKFRSKKYEKKALDDTSHTKQDIKAKKHCQISLHLLKNINKSNHEHCIHVDQTIKSETDSKSYENRLADGLVTTESTLETVPTSKSSSKSKNKRKHGDKLVKDVNRRDPVSLYHYYQSEWKKIKFPGEEEHAMLRRTIRKKLQDNQLFKRC